MVFADQLTRVELDALHSSIEALRARLRRLTQSPTKGSTNQQRNILVKNNAQDAQMSQLKSAMEKLTIVNTENSKKVKLVESALKRQESSRRWNLSLLGSAVELMEKHISILGLHGIYFVSVAAHRELWLIIKLLQSVKSRGLNWKWKWSFNVKAVIAWLIA